MASMSNPFVISGYVSAKYFCDREKESERLLRELRSGNHVALLSTRRMGKTGLIAHCFNQKEIKKNYYTFFVDIYPTRSLRDFVFALSKEILNTLKPFGRKVVEAFWGSVKSLQANVSFDEKGIPVFSLGLGDIQSEEVTLDEIFHYLEHANKPCIVAIDEFQQIDGYSEGRVEALLRTHIQRCKNVRFVFAGSQQHVMGNIFLSPSRPFYQSVSMMHLERIPLIDYSRFAARMFRMEKKVLLPETVELIYEQFDGVTWYMQKILNTLYSSVAPGEKCGQEMVVPAISNIIDTYKYTYSELLFRLPEKQKELLVAIAREGKAEALTSSEFVQKYRLTSSSSVQSALKSLLEKDYVTHERGIYQVYDKFLGIWLKEQFLI